MKINTSHSSRKQGFTLVELLVVIAIIATLASLGFVGTKGALEKAHKTTSYTHLTNITSGVNAFYADYSTYPNASIPALASLGLAVNTTAPTDGGTITTGTATNRVLIQALCGADPAINNRNIQYINGMEANASGKDGITYPVGAVGPGDYQFVDYWGNPYEVVWDANYDGLLDDPLGAATQLRRGVVAAGQGTSPSALSGMMSGKEQSQIVKTW